MNSIPPVSLLSLSPSKRSSKALGAKVNKPEGRFWSAMVPGSFGKEILQIKKTIRKGKNITVKPFTFSL